MTKDTAAPSPSQLVTNGVLRAADDLGLSGIMLARITGLSTPTISRLKRGSWTFQEGTKAYEIAMVLLRIHQALKTLMKANQERMRAWLRNRNEKLGGAPLALLERVHGLVRVLAHLEYLHKKLPVAA